MLADLQSALSFPLLLTIRTRILVLLLLFISPKKETLRIWILDGRVYGHASRRRKLVELLNFVVVAEAVAPPAGYVVYAIALHSGQKLPSTIVCARQFLLLLCLGGRIVLSWLFDRLFHLRY
jgi:hypothetical protein